LPNEVKQCFFLLFLFSIGFRTGPQFFRGLKSDGLAHTRWRRSLRPRDSSPHRRGEGLRI
jgi:hypothetical protein